MAASLDIYVEERVWCRAALVLCRDTRHIYATNFSGKRKIRNAWISRICEDVGRLLNIFGPLSIARKRVYAVAS